jgi:hypothetical protein
MAGDGRSAIGNLNGHETGSPGYSQGDTYGSSPFLDLAILLDLG